MRIMRIVSSLGCAFVLCAGSVAAQMDPGSGKKSPHPVSPAATKGTTDKPTETTTVPAGATSTPASEGSRPKQVVVPVDPITALREQIEATANPADKVSLQLKLAEQLVKADKKQDARNLLGMMVAEDRFDPQSFYNIGNAFARLGDASGAVVSYRKAIDQRKGRYSRALNNLGVVLMRLGDLPQAGDSFLQALKLESFRYAEASYNLGRVYAAQGQMDLAVREWRRAITVDPHHILAAQALTRIGNDDRITVAPAAAPPRAPNMKSPPPARSATSTRVLTVDPLTYNHLQRARDAHERGKDSEAIENYRSVISRMGGYFGPANLELSYILIGTKQLDNALIYLKPVTEREGARYPISYYHLARIYEVKSQLDLAAEAYDQAVAHFPGQNPQFLLDISRVREKRGDYAGALTAMEQYLSTLEREGLKPEWSGERLAALRQKVAASQPKQ